ncbi:hypothetical protein HK105_201311 [Polyrhizophydium stewartii]|uniref:Metallo-beta-lactamase domain-containing protein n=1 Tax=Polyrhizophydium stewartii TaxID=2732419 RepID=A0ABR4NHP7_9FUNG
MAAHGNVSRNTRRAAVIDPVLDFDMASGKLSTTNAQSLIAFVREQGLSVDFILETHVHADHLTSSQYIKKHLGGTAQICIGEGITKVQDTFRRIYGLGDSLPCDGSQFDRLLKDNDELPLGSMTIRVMHSPGHTPDHLAYLIGDALFVGDSLFMPDVGSARCDFPGGSATTLFASVHKRFWTLPDTTRVFVGHDYPSGRDAQWVATIGEQKRINKHVSAAVSESEFVAMRTARDSTLSAPRLLHYSLQVNMRAGKFDVDPDSGDLALLVRVPLRIPKAMF